MNFPEGLFSNLWTFGAFVPLALIWLWCLRSAPWKRLQDSAQLNVWLGAVVTLTVVWSMKAGAQPGLNLHLLGATALTLMFGRQLALLGLSLVMMAVTVNGGAGWDAYAINVLVTAVFPCIFADMLLRIVERYLPANFFVYVFVATFFGAALAVVSTGLLSTIVLWLAGIYPAEMLFSDYFPSFILLGFAEAWLNGAAITMMIVYAPHWVGSFDDRRYLNGKK